MTRHTDSYGRQFGPWAIALVGVVVLFVGAALMLRPTTSDGPSPDCPELQVSVPSELLPLVQEQALAAEEDGCATYAVRAVSAPAVSRTLSSGQRMPDVWVVDNQAWLDSAEASLEAQQKQVQLTELGSVAETPVVVAVPKSLAGPNTVGAKSWMNLGALQVTASNPEESTPSAVAFTAVWQAMRSNPLAQGVMGDSFMQVVRASVPQDQLFSNATKPADSARAFPATEQEIWKYNQSNPDSALSAMTPAEGAPVNTYKYLTIGEPTEQETAAAEALYQQLTSDAGKDAMRGAGFRVGAPPKELVPGVPTKLPGKTPELDYKEFDRIGADWSRVTQEIRLLIVTDVSGSMRAPVGGRTRIGLAVDAIGAAVGQMPNSAQAGLWVFSTNQREGGVDYRELVPVEQLGPPPEDAPGGQRAVLLAQAGRLPNLLSGDTGLNDTIWAAYQQEVRNAQPGIRTIVVVVTDGKNDDSTGGLSDDELIANLKTLKADAGDVRLVLVGMGSDPDAEAMRRITNEVDGETAIAEDPAELSGIFAAAVWNTRTADPLD